MKKLDTKSVLKIGAGFRIEDVGPLNILVPLVKQYYAFSI